MSYGRKMVTVALCILAGCIASAQQPAALTPYDTYEAALAELFDRKLPPSLGEVRVGFISDPPKSDMQVTFRQDIERDGAWQNGAWIVEVWYRPPGASSIFDEMNERYSPTQVVSVNDMLSWADVRRFGRRVERSEPLAQCSPNGMTWYFRWRWKRSYSPTARCFESRCAAAT